MDQLSEQQNQRKTVALMICLFIGFMYFETVWKPYFYGPINAPQPAPTQSALETPSPSAAPTDAASQFVEADPVASPESAQGVAEGTPAISPAPLEGGSVLAQAPKTYPSDAQILREGTFHIITNDLDLEISKLGGRVTKALILKYPENSAVPDVPLNLVKHTEYAPYPLGIYSGTANDAWTVYEVVSGLSGDSLDLRKTNLPAQVELRGALADGRSITKRLNISPNGFVVDVKVSLSAANASASRLALEWTRFDKDTETSMLNPYDAKGFTWFDGEKALRTQYGDFEGTRQELGSTQWITQGDKYFMAALISQPEAALAYAVRTGSLWRSRISGSDQELSARVFIGPKEYERLDALGSELQRNIDFGYTGFIAAPLLSLLHVVYGFVGNYGLAIVVLTILVRLALYPLAAASFKQMRAMQDLKPEIDRVREQVTDKQQQQMELMALYKKKGVNPLGGCLPIVLQMPIFIGLYSALMLSVELRNAHFAFWITDLSEPEKLMLGGIGVPIMVILFVISMMVQQWTTPSTMDPAQKKVMLVMPLVFGFMFMNFPAGLTLYWLTSNLISIGQQKSMYHYVDKSSAALKVTLAVSAVVFVIAATLTIAG